MDSRILAVMGKGFGDEGKGLAVDYFCSRVPKSLVIKHNGGAQAGHPVDYEGKHFVFHQLSAGSFRYADTFWANTYYPDLFKLREEVEAFSALAGFRPHILSQPDTPVTIIDDVLINMMLETQRGDDRHGSCGMGINEADLRTKSGFGITVSDLLSLDARTLVQKILDIRKQYGQKRLEEVGLGSQSQLSFCPKTREYAELLQSKTVVENAVEEMLANAFAYVTLSDQTSKLLGQKPQILFESGQGLLLDAKNETFAPHVTASRTGLHNPVAFLKKYDLPLGEAVYVTRTYVTRHGAGPLPYECPQQDLKLTEADATNVENPWQGRLRYAKHGTVSEFLAPIREDVESIVGKQPFKPFTTSLFLTHVNETGGLLYMADKSLSWQEARLLPEMRKVIDTWYLSASKTADGVQHYT